MENSEYDSESEQSCEDTEESKDLENINQLGKKLVKKYYYFGKDGITKCKKVRLKQNIRTRLRNIVLRCPGPKNEAKNVDSPEDCVLLFLDEIMLRHIVHCTNLYIDKISENFTRERNCISTNIDEIKVLLGLLIIAGLTKSSHRDLNELWEQNVLSLEIFRLIMSLKRFKFLLRCLRFNN